MPWGETEPFLGPQKGTRVATCMHSDTHFVMEFSQGGPTLTRSGPAWCWAHARGGVLKREARVVLDLKALFLQ